MLKSSWDNRPIRIKVIKMVSFIINMSLGVENKKVWLDVFVRV